MGFKKNQLSLMERALQKSQNAIGVFMNTIDELKQANEQIASAREDFIDERTTLTSKINQLNEQQNQNNHIIVRMESIVGGNDGNPSA